MRLPSNTIADDSAAVIMMASRKFLRYGRYGTLKLGDKVSDPSMSVLRPRRLEHILMAEKTNCPKTLADLQDSIGDKSLAVVNLQGSGRAPLNLNVQTLEPISGA